MPLRGRVRVRIGGVGSRRPAILTNRRFASFSGSGSTRFAGRCATIASSPPSSFRLPDLINRCQGYFEFVEFVPLFFSATAVRNCQQFLQSSTRRHGLIVHVFVFSFRNHRVYQSIHGLLVMKRPGCWSHTVRYRQKQKNVYPVFYRPKEKIPVCGLLVYPLSDRYGSVRTCTSGWFIQAPHRAAGKYNAL